MIISRCECVVLLFLIILFWPGCATRFHGYIVFRSPHPDKAVPTSRLHLFAGTGRSWRFTMTAKEVGCAGALTAASTSRCTTLHLHPGHTDWADQTSESRAAVQQV